MNYSFQMAVPSGKGHEPHIEKENGEQCDGKESSWEREGRSLMAERQRFGEANRDDNGESWCCYCGFLQETGKVKTKRR